MSVRDFGSVVILKESSTLRDFQLCIVSDSNQDLDCIMIYRRKIGIAIHALQRVALRTVQLCICTVQVCRRHVIIIVSHECHAVRSE